MYIHTYTPTYISMFLYISNSYRPNNSYRDKSLNLFNDEIVFLAGQSTAATALQSSFESNTKFQPLLSPFAQDHPAVSEGPGNSMLPSSPYPHKPSTPANQISETPSKLPSTPFLSPINATETLTPAMISRKALSTGGRSTSTPAHPRTGELVDTPHTSELVDTPHTSELVDTPLTS